MPRVGVLGATGAVGGVLRELLKDWDDVRYFASARSAGTELDGRTVEEATPDALDPAAWIVCFSRSARLLRSSSCLTPCAAAPSRSTSRRRGG